MPEDPVKAYEFGPFRFDLHGHVLTRGGESVSLTPKAADLLLALLENHGRLISKDALIKAVWPDTFVADSSLSFQLSEVRRALGPTAEGRQYVETLPRRGYRFIAPVREITAADMGDSTGAPESSKAPLPDSGRVTDRTAPATQRQPWVNRRGPRSAIWAAVGVVAVLVIFAIVLRSSPPPRIGRFTQLTHDGGAKDRPLLTDGVRIYFRTATGRFASVSVQGGETAPSPFDMRGFEMLDVSAARSEFLVGKTVAGEPLYELWTVAMASGSRRRVGRVMCDTAAWSPDGKSIAYGAGPDLFVAKDDGTDTKRLTTVMNGSPRRPRWSPDGQVIRFAVAVATDREVTKSIWEIRSDGQHLRPLPVSQDAPVQCCGSWTPDGEDFVFESSQDVRVSNLWILHEPRGVLGRTRARAAPLTAGPLSFREPVTSRDGKRVFAFGVQDRGELVRLDQTSGEFVRYMGGISATWVTFSRDGQWVAYVSEPERTLWRSRVDGSEKRQLTFEPLQVDSVSWSPDGRQIAFRGGMHPHIHTRIYLIQAEGGQPQALTSDDVDQGMPTWSADGTRIAFGDVPETFGHPTGVEVIHIYDLARHGSSALPGSQALWTSRWSPDGRYLAALTIKTQELMLFDFTTGNWRDLAAADHVNNPTWSRDSTHIYYGPEGDVRALRRSRISDGRMELLKSLEGYPSTAYAWNGLALDDSPIILRNLGAVEVYALDLERR